MQVATSRAGANLPAGIASALGAARGARDAVLEVDEAYVPAMIQAAHPGVVVLLNLSRDQLDRVNEVKMTADRWRRGLAMAGDGCTVVANVDDPMI
ncbi:ligase, partial [mine drainage metagenome]